MSNPTSRKAATAVIEVSAAFRSVIISYFQPAVNIFPSKKEKMTLRPKPACTAARADPNRKRKEISKNKPQYIVILKVNS
ncbi:MAG: hypothetical protein IKQ91_01765 [Oscillospiraceae bacterium]|nr:hypothetical protein [Oscillospiraceae bacterium]MBR3448398.1 hypothetical protein [Oscillospiraceae bacterium]MBR4199989.1 hypothetical protein [Oscillospiraceae bacterium]